MLNTNPKQSGVSLIELLIGLVIVGILLAAGAPAFSSWIQNTRIRTTAESIQNGLQLARAEAVRRNNVVRFQLTSTLDNNCTLSTSSSNWVVSVVGTSGVGDPTSSCGSAPSDTVAPYIIQTRSSAEGSNNTLALASGMFPIQSPVAFNGLGRQSWVTNGDATTTPNPPVNVSFRLSSSRAGDACAPTGQMRCLEVQVSLGGQIRMCDPALSSTDPQGC